MRYYLDTEFIEDGHTIDLISIGIASDDGREFYACSIEADLTKADEWVRASVLVHLPVYSDPAWKTRRDIRDGILRFLGWELPEDAAHEAMLQLMAIDPRKAPPEKVEVWAYYADYDWVAFCQLFGRMIDLPKGMPMFCRDLKQLSVDCGSPPHPKQTSGEHNALADARWNKELHKYLIECREGPGMIRP